jgi:hypothetical protein
LWSSASKSIVLSIALFEADRTPDSRFWMTIRNNVQAEISYP